MHQFRKNILSAVIIACMVLLTIAAMSPGLGGGFFFDDIDNIVNNKLIQITQINLDTLRASLQGPVAGPLGRPVSILSFAITHYFFGLDPYSFKAINLGIHLLNGLLVYVLVGLLLNIPIIKASPGVRLWLPIWVSAVWLVHPINILPVMLTVQRMTLLAGTFLLLAIISHLRCTLSEGRTKWAWALAAWCVFWPLSVLSKETGLLFPLYILVIIFFLYPSTRDKSRALKVSLSIVLLIALAAVGLLGWNWLDLAYSSRSFSLLERLMTEARVMWFYLAQIVVPSFSSYGIYLDDFTISKTLLTPATTIFSLLGWLLIIRAVFVWCFRQPLLCMCIAWFLIGHSLESTFLPLEIAYEYRNYIPSVGPILFIGLLGASYLPKASLDHPRTTLAMVAVIPLCVLAMFTWLRAQQLGDPLIGPQIEAARHPLSARANYVAATTLIRSGYGDNKDIIAGHNIRYYLTQASQVDPNFKQGYLGLIIWACASNRPMESKWAEGLSNRLKTTPFAPGDRKLSQDILLFLIKMPHCLPRDNAIEILTAATENSATDSYIKKNFYEAAADYELLVSKDVTSSVKYLRKAATLFPEDAALNKKLKALEAKPAD